MVAKINSSPFFDEIKRYLGSNVNLISEGRTKFFTPTFDLKYSDVDIKVVYYSPESLILCIDDTKNGREKLEEILPAFFALMGFKIPDFEYGFERRDKNVLGGTAIAIEWSNNKKQRYEELQYAQTKEYPDCAPGVRIYNLKQFNREIKPYPLGDYIGDFQCHETLILQYPIETFRKIYERIIDLIAKRETYSRTGIIMRLYAINFLINMSKKHWNTDECSDIDTLNPPQEFFSWCEKMLSSLNEIDPNFVDNRIKNVKLILIGGIYVYK